MLYLIADDPKWERDNGTFRPGYLNLLEKMLVKELLELKLKANPYIESRTKLLNRQYNAICEIITTRSGFKWND